MDQRDKNVYHSEEVRSIITSSPHWIIKFGNTIIVSAFIGLLAITWFIKYPDVVKAQVTITTEHPPIHFISQTSGVVVLFTKNGETVKKNRILASIKNPASTQDVVSLESSLLFERFNPKSKSYLDSILKISRKYLQLGNLQGNYQQFIEDCKDLYLFYSISSHSKQIRYLRQQIAEYNKLNYNLLRQKDILLKEHRILKNRYKLDSSLSSQKVLSQQDLENSEKILLAQSLKIENSDATILGNRLQMISSENKVNEINESFIELENKLIYKLNNSYKQLLSEIELWKQTYLVITPVAGSVSLNNIWSDNQFIKNGEEILTVIPPINRIFGKVKMPIGNSGKVEVGQKVIIKLDNFPSEQFGYLKGTVEMISQVASDNVYVINVTIPQELVTSYRIKLPFKPEMLGQAEIVTKDLRVLERFFYKFIELANY